MSCADTKGEQVMDGERPHLSIAPEPVEEHDESMFVEGFLEDHVSELQGHLDRMQNAETEGEFIQHVRAVKALVAGWPETP